MKKLIAILFVAISNAAPAQSFVHPGGLHTTNDLNRMKTQGAAGAHPWIDTWNVLITDSQAQTNYAYYGLADMGSDRQHAGLARLLRFADGRNLAGGANAGSRGDAPCAG